MTEVPDMQPWDQPGAFNPNPPEVPKVPRQKRKPREAAAPKAPRKPRVAAAPEAPAEPAKVRKPREAKVEPDTIKIGIKEYAEMRVTAFQREFVKLHKILAPIPGKARTQIIAELQKVFG